MQPLIILGASVRAAAFSARRGGFEPYAIDLFADRDLAAICPAVKVSRFPRDCWAALAAAPDAPWIYTGGLENHPRLVERLAAIRPLLGNGGAALRLVRHPKRLAAAALEAGCLFPPCSTVDRLGGTAGLPSSALARTEAAVPDPIWLLKPQRSGGGLGIRFATAQEIARPPRGMYLQQHIEGEAASAVLVAAKGRAALLGATRQLLGRDFGLDRPFLYVGSLGPLTLHDDEIAKLSRLGNVLAERFGMTGLFNVDFVWTQQKLWPVEVNPRYSASIEVLERVHDWNSLRLHVGACEQGALPDAPPTANRRFAGKAVVYAGRDGHVPPALDDLACERNQPGEWPGLVDLPRIGEALAAGQPVVTAIVEGESPQEVERLLRRRVAAVQRLLAEDG